MAQLNGALSEPELKALDEELALLPARIDTVIASVQRPVAELAERLASSEFFLYLAGSPGCRSRSRAR